MTTCPYCGGRLEEGFFLDHGYGMQFPVNWVSGAQEKTFWSGIKVRDRRVLKVVVLRCEACGALHLTAPNEPPVVG